MLGLIPATLTHAFAAICVDRLLNARPFFLTSRIVPLTDYTWREMPRSPYQIAMPEALGQEDLHLPGFATVLRSRRPLLPNFVIPYLHSHNLIEVYGVPPLRFLFVV